MTLNELLQVIEDIKKDLAYTQRLEERWVSEQKRFPLIYKYIVKQREFFQEKIDKAYGVSIDDSSLDEYIAGRPSVKVQKLKTAQVTPPAQSPAAEKTDEKTKPVDVDADDEDTKSMDDGVETEQGPEKEKAFMESLAAEKGLEHAQADTSAAQKAIDEAAAVAAKRLREQSPEPPTHSLSRKKEDKAEVRSPGKHEKQGGQTGVEKTSSRDKLRKLASEVLNEVKKSKDS